MTPYLTFLFLALIVFILFSIVSWTWKNGISPMPTSPKVKKTLIKNLPIDWKGSITELGSGWGTLAFVLAKKYPNCSIRAFENSPIPYILSKCRSFLEPHKNLHILRQNFFDQPLHESSMIVCYLYPGAMIKLKEKFENELKNGTLVISHTFAVPGWSPSKIFEVSDTYHSKIYFYIFKKEFSIGKQT